MGPFQSLPVQVFLPEGFDILSFPENIGKTQRKLPPELVTFERVL